MLKELAAKYYFSQNYNCAESVVRAANEYYDLKLHDRDMILVGAYGGGIQTGNTCGAYLGAAAVLSMKYVAQKAHESADIKPVVTMLNQRFTAEMESLLCQEIKPKVFQPEIRCRVTVDTVCDVLEKVIADYEAEKAR